MVRFYFRVYDVFNVITYKKANSDIVNLSLVFNCSGLFNLVYRHEQHSCMWFHLLCYLELMFMNKTWLRCAQWDDVFLES